MPELPEVETVCRGLEPALAGRRIASVRLNRPDLRFPFPAGLADALAGAGVDRVERRAKYILMHLSDGAIMLAHLGMTGRFTIWQPDGAAQNLGEFYFAEEAGRQGDGPHDHMVIDLEDGTRIVYADPRRFGFVDLIAPGEMAANRFLAGLGVEPLGNEFNADYLASALAGRKDPIEGSPSRSTHHCRAWQYICL
jgi:formamidopyrimidine-DNA glycosylase